MCRRRRCTLKKQKCRFWCLNMSGSQFDCFSLCLIMAERTPFPGPHFFSPFGNISLLESCRNQCIHSCHGYSARMGDGYIPSPSAALNPSDTLSGSVTVKLQPHVKNSAKPTRPHTKRGQIAMDEGFQSDLVPHVKKKILNSCSAGQSCRSI